MTQIGTLIILLVCVAVGYVVEPMFFSGVKKKPVEQTAATAADGAADDASEDPASAAPAAPEPEPSIQVDLSKIAQEDFPEKVTLKVPFTISDVESGVTVQLKKGSMVKPVSLEGNDLVVQPALMPIKSKIDVDKTNFKELAVPKMLERLNNAVTKNDPAPEPAPPVQPEATPAPVSAPDPEPEPEPEPEPSAKLDEAALITLLKKDVAAGKVTEFSANQVTAWKAGKDMEFDGKTYQTGLVTFKAETILGVQEHEAIALIEDGTVYKWMWAKTKLEMR